jgi:hypothetical protein
LQKGRRSRSRPFSFVHLSNLTFALLPVWTCIFGSIGSTSCLCLQRTRVNILPQIGTRKSRSERGLILRNLSLAFTAIAFVFAVSSSFAMATDAPGQATPPAPAATAAQPNAAAEVKTASGEDPSVIVCKRMAPETGTRLGSRSICHTNAEWEEISRQSQEAMREVQQRNATSYTPPPGVSGH